VFINKVECSKIQEKIAMNYKDEKIDLSL